jgi:hypothetical protein
MRGIDPLRLQRAGLLFEATAAFGTGQLSHTQLAAGLVSERNVEQVFAVGTDPRPGHIGAFVEEAVLAAPLQILDVDLGRDVAVGHEDQRLPVGLQLPQELISHPHGEP